MKKILFYALAVAALAFGCTKELNNETNVPDEGTTTVIKASVDTKTVLEGTKVKWVSGDQISVNGVTSDALSIAEPTASVDFTFGSDLAAEKKAVYPATFWTSDGTITLPATQALGTSASFDTDVEPLCAYVASGNTLSFLHTCAILKVQLKEGSDTDEISTVEFSGNNNEQVSGAFNINYSTGALTGTSGAADDKIVTVSVNETLSSTPIVIYFVVPAGTYSKGFTIKVTDENSHVMTRKTGAATLVAGHLYPLPVDTFDQDGTLKAWAKSFVKGLDVWAATVGNVDADSGHNGASGWKNVHYIPIGNSNNSDYKNQGDNQYDDGLDPWTFTVGATTYGSYQAWEIAIRGLMNMVTSEGEAFLPGMTNRNKAYTLADNAAFTTSVPSASAANTVWGKNPWYESPTVKDGGSTITSVDVNFMIKVCSWHVVRSFITNSGNTPLGVVGNFQQFGSGTSYLNLGSYSGQISPMRELLILMRIYKYLLDNNINENIYTAIKDLTFDFELYNIV